MSTAKSIITRKRMPTKYPCLFWQPWLVLRRGWWVPKLFGGPSRERRAAHLAESSHMTTCKGSPSSHRWHHKVGFWKKLFRVAFFFQLESYTMKTGEVVGDHLFHPQMIGKQVRPREELTWPRLHSKLASSFRSPDPVGLQSCSKSFPELSGHARS